MPIDFAAARRAARIAQETAAAAPTTPATEITVAESPESWEANVAAAAVRYRRASALLDARRRAFSDAMLAASEEGASVRKIAAAAGLSFQRVQKILRG